MQDCNVCSFLLQQFLVEGALSYEAFLPQKWYYGQKNQLV